MEKTFKHSEVEARLIKHWEETNAFNAGVHTTESANSTFSIVIPPPNEKWDNYSAGTLIFRNKRKYFRPDNIVVAGGGTISDFASLSLSDFASLALFVEPK